MKIIPPIPEVMTTRGFQEISQSGPKVIYRLKSDDKKNKFFTRKQKVVSPAGTWIHGISDLFVHKFLSTKYGPTAENGYNLLWFRADWPWN